MELRDAKSEAERRRVQALLDEELAKQSKLATKASHTSGRDDRSDYIKNQKK
jgi:hypothetical protein